MIGYHAIPVIVDAYMKGFDKIDGKELLEACIRSSVYDTTGIIASSRMVNGLVPISKYYKNKIGYIPYEKENESVAKGLEYAYNDWCIARLAEEIGDTATYEKYKALSKSYINYYDPQTRFMRGKDLKGNWHVPFNPRYSDHRNDDYCEGTAWQWAWFVPHDIEGLIALMGGQEKFIGRLDSLFIAESKIEGPLVSSDISGLIGQYAHGNEPSHHMAYLYRSPLQLRESIVENSTVDRYDSPYPILQQPQWIVGQRRLRSNVGLVCAQCDGILSSMSRIAHIFCRSSYLR